MTTKLTETYFVHYTVRTQRPTPNKPEGVHQNFSAGPYTEDEVLAQRRDIATFAEVTNVYVNSSAQRES